jgi:hypothetical protein
MNAIHRTGFDGLLNQFRAVSVLTNGTGAAQMRLNNECVACNMSAITAPDTNSFINPNSFVCQGTTQDRFHATGLMVFKR